MAIFTCHFAQLYNKSKNILLSNVLGLPAKIIGNNKPTGSYITRNPSGDLTLFFKSDNEISYYKGFDLIITEFHTGKPTFEILPIFLNYRDKRIIIQFSGYKYSVITSL